MSNEQYGDLEPEVNLYGDLPDTENRTRRSPVDAQETEALRVAATRDPKPQMTMGDDEFTPYERGIQKNMQAYAETLYAMDIDDILYDDRMDAAARAQRVYEANNKLAQFRDVDINNLPVGQQEEIIQAAIEIGMQEDEVKDLFAITKVEGAEYIPQSEFEEALGRLQVAANQGLGNIVKRNEIHAKYAEGGTFGSFVRDFGEILLPFGESYELTSFANFVLEEPQLSGSLDTSAPVFGASLSMKRISNAFKNATPEEQFKLLERVEQYFEEGGAEFLGEKNKLVVESLMNHVRIGMEKGSPSQFQMRIQDLINVLDGVAVGSLAVNVLGFPSRLLQSAALKAGANTRLAGVYAAAGETVSAGIDANKVLGNSAVPIPGTSSHNIVLNKEDLDLLEFIRMTKSMNLSQTEQAAVSAKIAEKQMERNNWLNTERLTYRHDMTEVNATDSGVSFKEKYTFRANTAEEVSRMVKDTFPGFDVKIKAPAVGEKGVYTIERNHTVDFGSSSQKLADLGFTNNIYQKGYINSAYIKLPEQLFDKDVVARATMLERTAPEISARIAKNLQGFGKLSVPDQRGLNTLIKKYAGVEIPKHEFNALNSSQKEAYHGMRRSLDTMWAADNIKKFEELKARGVMSMSVRTEDGSSASYLGRPYKDKAQASFLVESDAGRGIKLYDPETGKFRIMSRDEVYDNGYYVFSLEDGMSVGKQGVAKNILMKQSGNTLNHSLGDLPASVLSYKPNYIPGIYDKAYIVYRKRSDGTFQAMKATDSIVEAEKLSKELGAGGGWRPSREMDTSNTDLTSLYGDNVNISGGLVFGKKGEGLVDSAGYSAQLDNVYDATMRAVDAFGSRHALKEHIRTLKDRWVQTYDGLLKSSDGQYPSSKPTFLRATEEEAKNAQTMYNYIEHLDGARQSFDVKIWQQGMQKTAELFERSGLPKGLAASIAHLGMKDPTKGARALSFYLLLALNPSRQLLMQSQHALMSLAMVPNQNIAGNMHTGAMLILGGADDASKEMTAFYRSLSGVPADEYNQLLKLYKDLGIRRAVSVHTIHDDAVSNMSKNLDGLKWYSPFRGAADITMQGLNLSKKIGFEAGEHANSMAAFMSAVSKYRTAAMASGKYAKVEDVPINTKEAMKAISDDTSKFLWYMGNKSGTAPYNEGMLGVLMQYFTIQHKALATALPKVMGGRADVTGSERARMLGMVLAVYGIDGIGMTNTISRLERALGHDDEPLIDKETADVLRGGVMGTLLGMSNDGNLTNISTTFSPFGDNLAIQLASFGATLFRDGSLQEAWLQVHNENLADMKQFLPAYTAVMKPVNALMTTVRALQYETLDTDEKFMVAVRELAGISGTMNNLMKMETFNQMNAVISSRGDKSMADVHRRGLAAALLGVKSDEEVAVFEFIEESYRHSAFADKPDVIKSAQDYARDFWGQYGRVLVHHQGFAKDSTMGGELIMQEARKQAIRYFPEDSLIRYHFMETIAGMLNDQVSSQDSVLNAMGGIYNDSANMTMKQLDTLDKRLDEITSRTNNPEYKAIANDLKSIIVRRQQHEQEMAQEK